MDLRTDKSSILSLAPEERLQFFLALRARRRKSLETATARRAARQPKPKGPSKKATNAVANLSAEQVLALLSKIKEGGVAK